MGSMTKSRPRFRIGDWVTFRYGTRKLLVQVTEDRGLIGAGGRRLYGVRLDNEQDEPSTSEVPEDDLEPAPEIVHAHLATKRGFSTQNWPRVGFEVKYIRKGKSNDWSATVQPAEGVQGIKKATGVVGLSTARWEGETVADENHAFVLVLVEADPRLRAEVGSDSWRTMAKEWRIPCRQDIQVQTSGSCSRMKKSVQVKAITIFIKVMTSHRCN